MRLLGDYHNGGHDLLPIHPYLPLSWFSNPYGSGGGRPAPQFAGQFAGGPLDVMIQGVAGNPDLETVTAFLNRNAQNVRITNMQPMDNDTIVVSVEHAGQMATLLKLSGIRYAGGKLTMIGPSSSGPPPPRPGSGPATPIIPLLTSLVQSRYNQAAKFLNLESIHNDPNVVNSGIRTFEERTQFGAVICKIIHQHCPGVESISFASNRLRTLSHFESLHQQLPGLTALSFKDNQLNSLRDIEPISGKDFPNLRELLMTGNPFRERDVKRPGGDIKYRSDMKKLFPSIQVLDLEPILEDIQFGVDTMAMDLGLSVCGGFVDSEETAKTVQDFLQKFFHVFDNNRPQLVSFYDGNAIFSLSVNPIKNPNPVAKSERNFDAWQPFNRNLFRVKEPEIRVAKRLAHLKIGGDQIVQTMLRLPGTKHPVEDPAEARRFVVDAFQRSDGPIPMLHVNVEGQFQETAIKWNRSFSRAFIIIPAQLNSRALQAGLPYAIINDQLIVRSFGSNKGWGRRGIEVGGFLPNLSLGGAAPQAHAGGGAAPPVALAPAAGSDGVNMALANALGGMSAPAPAPNPAPQLPDEATLRTYQLQHNLTDQQHSQIIALARATGMNYQFSLQCLNETQWSMNAAQQAFNSSRANLPAHAFAL
ncbi:nuclear mRNA export, poly(A)+RNA binding protein [Rhizophlyctis rosea]|uniref:Nuclear mRNA export, poly(A)+RNA binding protein n=1 Tax=Rhizophlyctis rosea TaxID=64517 RepID=A0AAD5SIR3_9FUNG|nr:nuclear mRNA export, poly(A)+RNA binding protein [Rhizophlyctis rosea]